MSPQHDLNTVGGRLYFLRNHRREQYQSHLTEAVNPYELFSFCNSQSKFADYFGLDKRTVIRWEKNISSPDLQMAIDICKALCYPIDYLVYKIPDTNDFDKIFKDRKLFPGLMTSAGIQEDIVLKAAQDEAYLNYLNFVMDPKRINRIIKHIDDIQFETWLANTEIIGINGELLDIVVNAFNRTQLNTRYGRPQYQKVEFIEELKMALPEDKISFSYKNTETKFQVKRYIDKEFRNKIDTNSYEAFIVSLSDYFEPIRNHMLFESFKKQIAQEYMVIYEEYVKQMIKEIT